MSWTKLAVLGLTLLSLLIIWKTRQLWSAAFLGVLFALSLNGLGEWLRRYIRMPRWLATLLAILTVLITLTGLGWGIGSTLAGQFNDMFQQLPAATQKVLVWLDQRPWGQKIAQRAEDWSGISHSSSQPDDSSEDNSSGRKPNRLPREQRQSDGPTDNGEKPKDEAQPDAGAASSSEAPEMIADVASALSVTVNTGVLLVFCVMITLYVAFDPQVYARGVMWLVPKQHEANAQRTMSRLCVAMRWWVAGRLVSMMAVGALTSLGMWMIEMPAPLALGAIAGLLSFVPNIGPIMAAIPGLLLALTLSPWMVLWAGCIYLAAQLVEANAISPLIDQYAISVSPGLLIVTQLVFATLGGVWGMIVSTPLLVVLIVLVQELYINQGLKKQIQVTGST